MSVISMNLVLNGTSLKDNAKRPFDGFGAYERGSMGEAMS